MRIKIWIVLLIIGVFNSEACAENKFKGYISVNVKESSGSTYTTSGGFDILEGKDVIISDRGVSGKKSDLSNWALYKNSSKMKKYHSILNIYEVNHDVFKAVIKLYSNTINLNPKPSVGRTKGNLIVQYEIEGMLFTKNKYLYSDEGKPDLSITLEFEKIFSAEEIKERLNQSMKGK